MQHLNRNSHTNILSGVLTTTEVDGTQASVKDDKMCCVQRKEYYLALKKERGPEGGFGVDEL